MAKKSAMYKKEDVDKYGVSKLYLRNKALSHREISAFAVITFTFGLIVLVAVWSLVLQETTVSSCIVEAGSSCFPLLSDDSTTVNITMPTNLPVSDCSYWNSPNVTNYVEGYRCFLLKFDLFLVLSRFGGLLSIMLLGLRITFSLALAIIDTFFETFIQSPDEKQCWYKTKKMNTLLAVVKTGRIMFAFITYFIEIGMINIIQYRFTSSPNVQIGFEFVLIVGLLTASLLLPLEEYSLAQDQGGGGGVTPLSWQQSVASLNSQSPKENDDDSFQYHRLQSFDSIAYQRDISEA